VAADGGGKTGGTAGVKKFLRPENIKIGILRMKVF